MLDTVARENAQAQWTRNPCGGAVAKGGSRVSYFKRVELERYKQQPWMHDLFRFEQYGGAKVLEIGVGLGTDLIQFADAGADCHAIDITDEHMNLARENFALRGYQVDIRRSDATAIQHPDETFDVVYSFGVVHHIPEIDKVLTEVHRVLKPGGKALISVYHKWSLFHLASVLLLNGLLKLKLFRLGYRGLLATIETGADGKEIAPYVRLYSRKEFAKAMRSAGLTPTISVRQCHPYDMGRVGSILPYSLFKLLDRHMGWYVVAEATKA
jgi:ubiquinone/menaquinone biosynthesis C-methylase UbiE